MSAAPQTATRDRLIAAASELFARRGLSGTRIRQIAARAGVNVAAGHYHFGSKEALYLEVLREQFARMRTRLAQRGGLRTPAELAAMSRAELVRVLRARIETMLEVLLGPPPGVHGALMLREMSDPSAALPDIVSQFIDPMKREMEEIVARLAPGLRSAQVERCSFSIVAQIFFFRSHLPALLLLMGVEAYPRGFLRQLAEHVTEFSLGGMERLAAAAGSAEARRLARVERRPPRTRRGER